MHEENSCASSKGSKLRGDKQHPSATVSTARDGWDWPQAASLSSRGGSSSAFRGRSQDTCLPWRDQDLTQHTVMDSSFIPFPNLYLVPVL